ncbi:GGDEF domain-containing protein [Thalassotalea fonticola]|uniref:diguanylate cyclase n=1 Tax=Thalassotalea fonticola TaxID=3065649 RepID=A0ABZ0GTP4_9GAMM|nr:GGDEF domain-containing protein [Colwelliaceae bacterium S1-1]
MPTAAFNLMKEQLKPLLFVLVISAVGFILNLYPIPLFANIHLILGNVAFVIVAMRFGALYSLLSAVIVATAFVISFSHPFGYLVFGLEALFIALLRKRGWYIIYADLCYWLLIGMPLSAVILNSLSDMPEQLWLLTVVKQALNGLVYTCLAGLIVYFFPKTFALKYRQQPRVLRSFKAQLVYATTLIITFSIMAISIFVTQSVIKSQHQILEKSIAEHKQYLKLSADRFIEEHILEIENATSNFTKFEQIIPVSLRNEISYVITGQNNNIIYASQNLKLALSKSFNYTEKKDLTFKNTGLVKLQQQQVDENLDYFITKDTLNNGWEIYVLLDSSKVIQTVEREYLLIFNLLFLAFLISISLAQRVGQQITKPLNFIIKQLKNSKVDNSFIFKPLYANSAKEIVILYDELQRSKTEINNYQNKLEKEVEQRTCELQIANEKLTQLAQKDGLTQLYNRRYFDEHFALFQKMAMRSNNNVAVVLLDIDEFKLVNDLHGHLVGDECLKIISATLMKEFSRSTDLISRYGGEEFILLVNQISEKNLVYKLEKLRKIIASTIIYNQKHEGFKLTASIGGIIAPASFSSDAKDWIKIADLCLYKAKNSGRNNVKMENFSELL